MIRNRCEIANEVMPSPCHVLIFSCRDIIRYLHHRKGEKKKKKKRKKQKSRATLARTRSSFQNVKVSRGNLDTLWKILRRILNISLLIKKNVKFHPFKMPATVLVNENNATSLCISRTLRRASSREETPPGRRHGRLWYSKRSSFVVCIEKLLHTRMDLEDWD